jgi:hypothetical protein
MTSHELFRALLRQTNPKELSSQLGLSPSLVYKWAEPSGDQQSGTPNPLELVRQLIEFTKDPRIADWICSEAGGFFVRNSVIPEEGHARSLASATNAVVQEFADMLSIIATAALDDAITDAEALTIRNRWQKLQSIAEQFVQWCEEKQFEHIRNHAHQHVARQRKQTETGSPG